MESEKDQDQDRALLHLERALARLDEWKTNHRDVHEVESIQRDLLRQTMNTRVESMEKFMTRDTYEKWHEALVARVTNLERMVPVLILVAGGISAAVTAALLRAFGG